MRSVSPRVLRLTVFAGLCAGMFVAATAWYWFAVGLGQPVDAHAYWMTRDGVLYKNLVRLSPDAFLYSPAFAQVIAPITAFDFGTFLAIWRGINLGAFVSLAGPLSAPLLFWSPVTSEVSAGNIHLLFGVAIVIGFRWPATWALILLTKVTPGVGLLWFVVRREWHQVAIVAAADGFLYKMVRSLCGLLIRVGEGDVPPGEARRILETRERTARVPTAPAAGLFLWRVWY